MPNPVTHASGTSALPAGGLSPGSRVGSYLIECELGRGGMGVVYRAKHVGLEKTVAIKIISVNSMCSGQAVARLKREGETLAKLRHPNILAATDCGEINGWPYLVLDFVDGGTVEAWVRREGGKLAEADVRAVLHGLLSGLKSAHEAGIIHRDIKPANLLLEADRTVRISDFGLAQAFAGANEMTVVGQTVVAASSDATVLASSDAPTSLQVPNPLTGSGTFAGTIQYMAPELHTNPRGDARSDIYAVGVTAYYLLTGHKPGGKFKPATKRVRGINRGWDAFIGRCLEQDPDDRFQDASAALAALVQIRIGKRSLPRAVVWGVAGAAAAGVIALAAFHFGQNPGGGGGGSGPLPASVLKVTGLPDGAQLQVDSVKFPADESGRIRREMSPGEHSLIVWSGDVKVAQTTVTVGGKGETEVDFGLRSRKGPEAVVADRQPVRVPSISSSTTAAPIRVVLESDEGAIPTDTTLSIDGRIVARKGSAPFAVDVTFLASDVVVAGPGLVTSTVRARQRPDGGWTIPLTWKEYTVTLQNLPKGAVVTIDGSPVALTPGQVAVRVRHGTRRLQVRSDPYYEPVDETLQVTGDLAYSPRLAWKSAFTLPLPGKQSLAVRRVDTGKYAIGSASSEPGRQQSDADLTEVTVEAPFLIGETEVTQGQYAAVMALTHRVGSDVNPSRSRARQNPNLPVEQVSYLDITGKNGFLDALNAELMRQGVPLVADLPDEQEWEIACRAGTRSSYSSGVDLARTGTDPALDRIAHYNKAISTGEPLPVRSKEPNKLGGYDFQGNVAEIACEHRRPASPTAGVESPAEVRVYARGGSWKTPAEHTRCASRVEIYRDRRSPDLGFRIVLRPAPRR